MAQGKGKLHISKQFQTETKKVFQQVFNTKNMSVKTALLEIKQAESLLLSLLGQEQLLISKPIKQTIAKAYNHVFEASEKLSPKWI